MRTINLLVMELDEGVISGVSQAGGQWGVEQGFAGGNVVDGEVGIGGSRRRGGGV